MAIGGIKGITIKIGGDTKELTQALQDAKNQAKVTTREMQEINRALIANPQDATLHAQQQANFRTQLEQTKQVMEALTQADVVMKQRLADGEIDTKTYEAWQREIIATEGELQKLSKRLDENGQALTNFGEKVGKVGKQMGDFGKSWSMYVSAPLMAGAAVATKAAMDYETAFIGIRKTTDMTEEGFRQLDEGIREMANTLPATQVELANLGEAAGRMNISNNADEILEFTKVIVDMGAATDLAGEQAADTMGMFAKVSGMAVEDFSRLGSAVVELGNNGLVTESQIMTMAQRIVATGTLVGMSEADIVGLSAALGNVGVQAEAGGTSMSKFLMIMQSAVETGGEKLQEFARVSGMSASEFARLFEEDATEAVLAFINGLGQMDEAGESAILALGNLGLNQDRIRMSLLSLAGAHEDTEETIRMASRAWEENNALLEEANLFYDSSANKMKVAQNQIRDAAITIGQELLPMLVPLAQGLANLVSGFTDLDPMMQKFILGLLGAVAAVGPFLKGTSLIVNGVSDISKAIGGLQKAAAGGSGLAQMLLTLGPKAAAVTAAVAGLALVATSIYKIATATTEAEQNIKEFNETVAKIGEAQASGSDHLVAQVEATEDLVSEIERLNRVEELSATQKAELQSAVEQLTSVFPDLNLEIDETTGKIEDLDTALDELVKGQIQRSAEQLKQDAIQAYTDAYVTSVQQRIDAEAEYDRAIEESLTNSEDLTERELEILRKFVTGQALTLREQEELREIATRNSLALTGAQVEHLGDLARAVDAQAELEVEAKDRIKDAYEEYARLLNELGIEVPSTLDEIADADDDLASTVEGNTGRMDSALSNRVRRVMDYRDAAVGAYQDIVDAADNAEGVHGLTPGYTNKFEQKLHNYSIYTDSEEHDRIRREQAFANFQADLDLRTQRTEEFRAAQQKANEDYLKAQEKYEQDLQKQRDQWATTLQNDTRKWQDAERRAQQENAKADEKYRQDLAKQAKQWQDTLAGDKRKWAEFERRANEENLRIDERYQQALANQRKQWQDTLKSDQKKWAEFERRARQENLKADEKYRQDLAKQADQWARTLYNDTRKWHEFEQRANEQNARAREKYQQDVAKKEKQWADALKRDRERWLEYERRAREQNLKAEEKYQEALQRQRDGWAEALKRDQRTWLEYEIRAEEQNERIREQHQAALERQEKQRQDALKRDEKKWRQYEARARDQNLKNEERYQKDLQKQRDEWAKALEKDQKRWVDIQAQAQQQNTRNQEQYANDIENATQRHLQAMASTYQSGANIQEISVDNQFRVMTRQRDNYRAYLKELEILESRVGTEMFNQLKSEGVSAYNLIKQYNEMALPELAKHEDLYVEMYSIARELALEETEKLPEITAEGLLAQEGLYRDAEGYLRHVADDTYASVTEAALEHLERLPEITAESLALQDELWRDAEGYLRDSADNAYATLPESAQVHLEMAELVTAESLARQNWLWRDSEGYLRDIIDNTYKSVSATIQKEVVRAEDVTADHLARQNGLYRDNEGYLRKVIDDSYANVPESAFEAAKMAELVTAESIAAQQGLYRDSAGYLRDAYDGAYANLPESALEAVTRAEYVTASSIAAQQGLYRDSAGYLRDAYDHSYANLPDSALEAVSKAEYTNATSIARQQGLWRDSAGYLRSAYDDSYANLPASALEAVTRADRITADFILAQQGLYRDNEGYLRRIADDSYANLPAFAQEHLEEATRITDRELAKQLGFFRDHNGKWVRYTDENWRRYVAALERSGKISRETAAEMMDWVLVELDKPVSPKGEQVGEGMHTGMIRKKDLVKAGAKSLQKEVEKGFKPNTNKMITDMIDGLDKGVERSKKRITGVGEKFAVELAGGYNKYLEISSPSRFFERSIGYMADGAERGEVKNRKRFGEIAEDIAEPFRQIEGVTSGEVEVSSNLALRGIFDYTEMAQALSQAMDDVRVNLDSTSVGRVMYRGQQQALRG